jgi:hypothetical protein
VLPEAETDDVRVLDWDEDALALGVDDTVEDRDRLTVLEADELDVVVGDDVLDVVAVTERDSDWEVVRVVVFVALAVVLMVLERVSVLDVDAEELTLVDAVVLLLGLPDEETDEVGVENAVEVWVVEGEVISHENVPS